MPKDNLSHEEYINNIYNQINIMIRKKHKISLAKKMISEQLERFPNNAILLSQLISCSIEEKDYENALKILEEAPEEKVFLRLASLYIKLGKEEKLLEIFQKYYQTPIEEHSEHISNNYEEYKLLGVYLKSKYLPDYRLQSYEEQFHTRKQFHQYSAENAIEFIKKTYCKENEAKKRYFTDNIDIESLFYKVQKYISAHPEQSDIHKIIYERYYFHYPHCGETRNGQILNNILVYTIIGSPNIISMFPTTINKNFEIVPFEKLEEETITKSEHNPKSKVKRPLTGLERFNQKYGSNGNSQ